MRAHCRIAILASQKIQLESGRQVGCWKLVRTIFPLTDFTQFITPAESLVWETGGTMTTSPEMPPAGVPGLHGTTSASRFFVRGATSSARLNPRVQSRHVPYCSFFAVIPIAPYVFTIQSLAERFCGDPVSRGPMESISTWP